MELTNQPDVRHAAQGGWNASGIWRKSGGSDTELATLAQDTPDAWTHLGEELADVQIYLARLADVLGVDMAAAVADKQAKNARKYPEPQA